MISEHTDDGRTPSLDGVRRVLSLGAFIATLGQSVAGLREAVRTDRLQHDLQLDSLCLIEVACALELLGVDLTVDVLVSDPTLDQLYQLHIVSVVNQ